MLSSRVLARPILYSPAMVRARHDGRKTQTRRVMKPQPFDSGFYRGEIEATTSHHRDLPTTVRFNAGAVGGGAILEQVAECPFGKPGDLLWCREAWFAEPRFDHLPPREIPKGSPIWYAADGRRLAEAGKPRSARFMCRWMSRSTDRLTDIRPERLQDISEEDAKAEGAACLVMDDEGKFYERDDGTYRTGFCGLWNSLHEKDGHGWDVNDWLWVLTYSTELRHVDAVLAELAA